MLTNRLKKILTYKTFYSVYKVNACEENRHQQYSIKCFNICFHITDHLPDPLAWSLSLTHQDNFSCWIRGGEITLLLLIKGWLWLSYNLVWRTLLIFIFTWTTVQFVKDFQTQILSGSGIFLIPLFVLFNTTLERHFKYNSFCFNLEFAYMYLSLKSLYYLNHCLNSGAVEYTLCQCIIHYPL